MAASILGTSENSLGATPVTSVVAPSRAYTTGSSLDIYTTVDNGSTQAWSFTDSSNSVAGEIGGVTPVLKDAEVVIGSDRYRHYVAEGITGFTGTITGSFASSAYPSICVVEVGGVTAPAYNAGNNSSQASPGTGTDAIAISATSTSASGIVLGFVCDDTAANRIPTAGTGFTDRGTFWAFGGSNKTSRLISAALSSTGSKTAQWTANASGGSDNYATFVSIFNDAAGGGGGGTTIFPPIAMSRQVGFVAGINRFG